MTLLLHQACVALKRKAARGKRAPRALSIAGGFFPLPWLASAADSVAPLVCHLARAAASASPAALHGDAQNGNTLATTPDRPTGVGTAVRWPTSVVRAQPLRDGRSNSPVQ